MNEVGGTDVLAPGYLYHYTLDASQAGAFLISTARSVVDALHPFDDTLNDPQRLAEQASGTGKPLDLITLRVDDNNSVAPGARQSARRGDHAAGRAAADGLSLRPGPDQSGEEGRDRRTRRPGGLAGGQHQPEQRRSGGAARGRAGAGAIGVDQPGPGRAERRSARSGQPGSPGDDRRDQTVDGGDPRRRTEFRGRRAGPLATTGLYPPGSTFKMVTAGAVLERDMASPNTLLACPGHLDIGQRVVPNYGGFDLGTVPMSRAFASSCNTTFAELASQMPPRGLTQAANQYGMGLDYQVDGISTVTGSVPPTVDLAERTEDGFGQGKVLASRSAWRWSRRPWPPERRRCPS